METTECNPKTHPVYPVCNICTASKVFNICCAPCRCQQYKNSI